MGETTKLTLELEHPIPVPKKEGGGFDMVDKLTIGRIKVKHLKALPQSLFTEGEAELSAGDVGQILVALTGFSEETIGEIDLNDLGNMGEKIAGFFEATLESLLEKSGKRSSGE